MTKNEIKIAPSILAGDFASLGDEAKRIEEAGADFVHVDVMDGHFVPNLTFGPKACAAIKRSTNLFVDVHLMIYNPFEYVERFVEAGADNISFHIEATEDVEDTLNYIRKCNVRSSLALCPETPVSMAIKYFHLCDMILLMTVHPGFGGQEFIEDVLDKIKFTREYCEKHHPEMDIEVDGGINEETATRCKNAGANVIVAGTYCFKAPDIKAAIGLLRG